MSDIRLMVDTVVIRTELERAAAERLPAALRQAFRLLAERLGREAWAAGQPLDDLVLGRLEVDMISADELLGPRGAARLADELYRRITGGAA